MLSESQHEAKWNEIKSGVRNLWGRLSEEEVEAAKGNLTELSTKIEDRYNESKETIKEKFEALMDSFDNDTDKNISPDRTSYHRRPEESDQFDARI